MFTLCSHTKVGKVNVNDRIVSKEVELTDLASEDDDPSAGWKIVDSVPKGGNQASMYELADTFMSSAVPAEKQNKDTNIMTMVTM